MIVISTYKVYCEYCGGSGYKSVKIENLLHPEEKADKTELTCPYCGREIKEAELIDRKYYTREGYEEWLFLN